MFSSGQDGQRSALLSPWFSLLTPARLTFYFRSIQRSKAHLDRAGLGVTVHRARSPLSEHWVWQSEVGSGVSRSGVNSWIKVEVSLPAMEDKVSVFIISIAGQRSFFMMLNLITYCLVV